MARDTGMSAEQGPMLSSTSLDEDTIDEPIVEAYMGEETLAQRKRHWWRDAIINLAFIGSWCVN
jgi:hypothetical protein